MPMPPYPPATVTATWEFSYGTGGGDHPSGMHRNIGLWTTLGTFFFPGQEEFWFSNICDYTAHLDGAYLASLGDWTVDLEGFPFINKALLSVKWVGSFSPPGAPVTVPLPVNPNNVEDVNEVMVRLGIFGLPDFYDCTFKASVSASDPLTELHVPFYGDATGANPSIVVPVGVVTYPPPFIPNNATAVLVPGDNVGSYTLGFDVIATKVAWWWRLEGTAPDDDGRDKCGNLQPGAPYIYTPYDPSEATGFRWEKYNPLDYTDHPTPVILSIDPSHGLVNGDELITIHGSGFGTEATVTFDGIDATDVDVLTSETIQCRNPSHAAGFVNVVVTNFDGFSSS